MIGLIIMSSVLWALILLTLRDHLRQEKIARFIAKDLWILEKQHPTKFGFDYKYKVRNGVLVTKYWQVRGRNAWEIFKTTKHEL